MGWPHAVVPSRGGRGDHVASLGTTISSGEAAGSPRPTAAKARAQLSVGILFVAP